MASAYAALVSLMNVLDIIKHPKNPASNSHLDNSQVQSLFDKLNSLVDLLEAHSHCISKDLEKTMIDAAFATEDTIESYLVGIQRAAGETSCPPISQDTGEGEAIQEAKENNDRSRKRDVLKRRLTKWWMRLTTSSSSVPVETSTPILSQDVEIQKLHAVTADETSSPLIAQHLDKAVQEMDLIIQEAMLQVEQNNGEHGQLTSTGSMRDVGTTPVPHSDTVKVVGLEEETERLIHQLTSHQESNRQVIPIVGMGGIGKTTLATSVYSHPRLRHCFDVKAWVTISQVYSTRSILLPILHAIGVEDIDKIKDDELGRRLHQGLMGRTYLIVIDDIWDVGAWDKLINFCPEQNNGSRIILTTRIVDVANRVSSCRSLDMQLLDEDRSWDLLSQTVFQGDVCPPELENCGKEIAKNCKGLPLAIIVIGGLLKMSHRTRKQWGHVERNIRSIIGTEHNDHCMKILSLSYNQLPIHLKPCFLYMATFPEDYVIRVSEVAKLWVADGFLKPREDGKSLDDVALECLTDLISRNLVIVNNKSSTGRTRHLTVHDLVRDICIKEAQNEKFLRIDDGVAKLPNSVESERRLVFHGNGSHRGMRQMGLSRSFIWFRKHHLPPKMSLLCLLRVIVSLKEEITNFEDIVRLVNLRLMKISIKKNSLSSISWALNLETLILDDARSTPGVYWLPEEIWNLWRLKHLIVTEPEGDSPTDGSELMRAFVRVVDKHEGVVLPTPPPWRDFSLESLQTLKGVLAVFIDLVLHGIPNVKIMRIECCEDKDFVDFGHLQKLEKLYLDGLKVERTYKFPSYLRKLTLSSTRIQWKNMTIVGSLPNLDSLFLEWDAFIGEEWISVEGEFEKLKYLKIFGCMELVRWEVEDSSHFPCLEQLTLRVMSKLEEIPLVFGELMTLVSIMVRSCSESAIISAREILEAKQGVGNDDLVVQAHHQIQSSEYTVEMEDELRQKLQGSANDNFHLQITRYGQ